MKSFPPIDSLSAEERERFFSGPAQLPPEDVIPRPGDTPDHNGDVFGILVACIVLTCTAVILRAYTQILVKKQVAVEDGLALLAFTAFCGIIWTTSELLKFKMFDNHQWDISVRDFENILFALYIWPTMYGILMGFIKSAILLEWAKIFVPKGIRNKFWWSCMFLVVFNGCFYLAAVIAVQFYCTPHERIWRRGIPGTCMNRKSLDLPSSIFNLVIDVIILLLPQKVIWKLHLSTAKKISISFIFGIGVLAAVSAAGRVYAIAVLDYDDDITYYARPIYMWSMAECTCVMLVFCIPPIPRLFTDSRILAKIRASLRSRSLATVSAHKGSISSSDSDREGIDSYCPSSQHVIQEPAPGTCKEDPCRRANFVVIARTDSNLEQQGNEPEHGILRTTKFYSEEHYLR